MGGRGRRRGSVCGFFLVLVLVPVLLHMLVLLLLLLLLLLLSGPVCVYSLLWYPPVAVVQSTSH